MLAFWAHFGFEIDESAARWIINVSTIKYGVAKKGFSGSTTNLVYFLRCSDNRFQKLNSFPGLVIMYYIQHLP